MTLSIRKDFNGPVWPLGLIDTRSSYNSWLAGGGKYVWMYYACYSCANGTLGDSNDTYEDYAVDTPATNQRVARWLAYLYNMSGELYYDTDYCFDHDLNHSSKAV